MIEGIKEDFGINAAILILNEDDNYQIIFSSGLDVTTRNRFSVSRSLINKKIINLFDEELAPYQELISTRIWSSLQNITLITYTAETNSKVLLVLFNANPGIQQEISLNTTLRNRIRCFYEEHLTSIYANIYGKNYKPQDLAKYTDYVITAIPMENISENVVISSWYMEMLFLSQSRTLLGDQLYIISKLEHRYILSIPKVINIDQDLLLHQLNYALKEINNDNAIWRVLKHKSMHDIEEDVHNNN